MVPFQFVDETVEVGHRIHLYIYKHKKINNNKNPKTDENLVNDHDTAIIQMIVTDA